MSEQQVEAPERIWISPIESSDDWPVWSNFNSWKDGIQYIRADLFSQPTSERCKLCGHADELDPRGRCMSVYYDAGGSLVYCGHKCEFAATGARDGDLVHHVRRVLLYCSNFGDSVCICGDEQPKGTHDDECEDAQRLYERIATIRGGSG